MQYNDTLQPCVNQAANNAVDVCCRDPNYKDPWPNMEGNMQQNNPPRKQGNQQGKQGKPGMGGGRVCGSGQGACCAGSNAGCPAAAPICSENGYCQCSTYRPGGPACGPGFDDDPWPNNVGISPRQGRRNFGPR